MKKNKAVGIGLAAFVLLILVILSIVIVFNVFVFSSENAVSNKTICITANAPAFEPQTPSEEVLSNIETSTTSNSGGATIFDTDQTWTTYTQLNIFEHGDTTVQGDGTGTASHVIAPGTSNDYIFSLQNDRDYNIKYTVQISGGNDSDYALPVSVQILDSEGNILTDWVSIGMLNNISTEGNLKQNSDKQYIIRWQWAYEHGTESTDLYDTFLGDKAVGEELACHINIKVISEYDYTPSEESSQPSDPVITGDNSNMMIYIILLVCTAGIVLAIILIKKVKKYD